MTQSPGNFRNAFLATLFVLIAVLGFASWLFWHSPLNPIKPRVQTGAPITPTESTEPSVQNAADSEVSVSHLTDTAPRTIQLTPQRMQSIGVKIGKVESKLVNDEIRANGYVQLNERSFVYIQTRLTGWIREVYANATGDVIKKGQPLFTIYSPDLIAAEREYLFVKKNAQTLQDSQAGSGVADEASSLTAAAATRLERFDLPDGEIERLDKSDAVISDLIFKSPASGYITERNALPNMYVQPDTKLYTLANLSNIWVLAQVFQNDANKIALGNAAEVTSDSNPVQVFKGTVDYILPQLDATTRTLSVRLVIPNTNLKLRPGMYVNVSLKLPLGRKLVVPDTAVFHSGTKNTIFMYAGEGNIQPREVEVGPHIENEIVIAKGAKAGEQIVTSANFLIDSEVQLQEAAGSFATPPPGAGQAAAMNAPTQANVELTTTPTTPQKGMNVVRVKLTDQAGKPITGAQVSVTFSMAAMPAMGMAAMKTAIQASDKGNGVYEGSGTLGSGGTWQVTITAQQNGQPIANRQLSVTATGGM
jgi:RND family efflux transporter MFP subunit